MKMRVLHRYPTQKKLGLYNVPVSRVDETASKLAIAFKHDKGLMADTSGFRVSGFDVLPMTYHNPRSALPNDDITNFPRLNLDR